MAELVLLHLYLRVASFVRAVAFFHIPLSSQFYILHKIEIFATIFSHNEIYFRRQIG